MRNKKTLWLSLMLTTFIFLMWHKNLFSNEQESKFFQLTTDQEELINLVNEKRIESEIVPFRVINGLTKFLTRRLEGIVQEAQGKSDEKLIEGRIEEFLTNLGPNAFFSSDSSIEEAFDKLMKNEKLKNVLYEPSKIAIAPSVVRTKPGEVFIVFYLTECLIEWGPQEVSYVLGSGDTNFRPGDWTITGTSKSKYLKFISYEDEVFYFECDNCKKTIKEVVVEKNGTFSVNLTPIEKSGQINQRVAVLAKDIQSQDYILVDYLVTQ